jgi:predicted Holliday junction resolvase-like endonuclease
MVLFFIVLIYVDIKGISTITKVINNNSRKETITTWLKTQSDFMEDMMEEMKKSINKSKKKEELKKKESKKRQVEPDSSESEDLGDIEESTLVKKTKKNYVPLTSLDNV